MNLNTFIFKKSFYTFGYSAWNNVSYILFFSLIMDIENLTKHMILALLI